MNLRDTENKPYGFVKPETLVIYELEPIGEGLALEATGRVYHFCSDFCRDTYATKQLLGVDFKTGNSPDAIEGTVCDECGTEL